MQKISLKLEKIKHQRRGAYEKEIIRLGTALGLYAASVLPAKALQIENKKIFLENNNKQIVTDIFYPEDTIHLEYDLVLEQPEKKFPFHFNKSVITVDDYTPINDMKVITQPEVHKSYTVFSRC